MDTTPPTPPSAFWLPFGARLRSARERAALTQVRLAELTGVPCARLDEVEQGDRCPSRSLVERIDAALGTGGALARDWADTLMLEAFPQKLFTDLEPLEAHAAEIREYQPMTFPPFLRTPGYARVMRPPGNPYPSPKEAAAWVAEQERRRARLTAGGGPRLWVILNDSVLDRPQGGWAVLHEQLGLIAGLVRDRVIGFQLLLDSGPNPGPGGAFRTMAFRGRPGLAYEYHALGGHLTTDPEQVGREELLYDTLSVAALPPADSVEILAERSAAAARRRAEEPPD